MAASNGSYKLSYGLKYEKFIAALSPFFQPSIARRLDVASQDAAEDLLYASHCDSVLLV